MFSIAPDVLHDGVRASTTEESTAMRRFASAARKLLVDEEGATLVEYSLLVALLAAASIAILYGLGQNVRSLYTQVNTAVGTANIGITSAS
jgi:Flp pilus assembly pilin Flp